MAVTCYCHPHCHVVFIWLREREDMCRAIWTIVYRSTCSWCSVAWLIKRGGWGTRRRASHTPGGTARHHHFASSFIYIESGRVGCSCQIDHPRIIITRTLTEPRRRSLATMAAPPVQPAPANAFRLGFIGAGNLAESIARGVAASGVLPASAIRTAPHRRPERGAAFASIGARLFDSNAQAGSRVGGSQSPLSVTRRSTAPKNDLTISPCPVCACSVGGR
jgi:hypothetical protein